MNKIFFTADTHFFHSNILKHCPDRQNSGPDNIIEHDEWLIDLWNNKIEKKDIVYIVGDFAFGNKDRVIRLMGKLNGTKHLIVGNHDASSIKLPNYFESVQQIKDLTFKTSLYPFLEKDFYLALCHYPLISWNRKNYGACMVHGHCHGRIDEYNRKTGDLRVDVGIDGTFARECGGFISLEELYQYFLKIAQHTNFARYVADNREHNPI
jgi:calcineurin-like phosphoesterase family protein